MPRSNRRRGDASRRVGVGAGVRREAFRGREYLVRPITGAAATKPYRCPACQQEIGVGRPHVVAWPDDPAGAADRRHWHTACWSARDRRG